MVIWKKKKKKRNTTIEIERDNSVSEIRIVLTWSTFHSLNQISREPISRTWRVKKEAEDAMISLESSKPD